MSDLMDALREIVERLEDALSKPPQSPAERTTCEECPTCNQSESDPDGGVPPWVGLEDSDPEGEFNHGAR